ncbi:hypothetical protein AcV7_006045 [Taiwanofungus camphoratus]|nr:hypothetical protein AcV7_006045 [Antrodia cinnamomea]
MSAQKAQTEKDKGNAAFKAGDFPTAIGHYTAAVLADPANPTYPLNRAAAYLKLGKNEDAERDCTTVLKLGEGNIKAVFRRGQARVAMQKLREAEVDFRSALKLEPANEAVKQELKRVEEMLQRRVEVKSKGPADVISGPFPSTSSSAPTPKRRRIPIEVVDPSASSSTAAATTTAGSDAFMTPVSSRPLSSPSPSPSRVAAAAPMTLFTLTKRWERLQTAEERWALINEIDPAALPALFQSSLEASLLSSLLATFLDVLRALDGQEQVKALVKAYMLNLARVPRFSTVVLFMSPSERVLVKDIWALVGPGEERRGAWGLS